MPDKPRNETPPADEAAEQARPREAAESRPRGLGETLRAVREAERLSIERVAAELRIEPRYLIALEEERFEAVGPPVFAKGYLRLYAECLGLDTASALRMYEEKAGTAAPPFEGRRSVERRDSTQGGLWILVGLVAAAVLAALLGLWLLNRPAPATVIPAAAVAVSPGKATAPASGGEDGAGQAAVPAQNAVSALEEAVSRHDQAVPAGIPGAAGQTPPPPLTERTGGGSGPSAPAATATNAARAAPSPAAAPVAAASAAAPEAAASTASGAPATAATSAAGAGVDGLEMDLQFLQDSWVEVTDARKQRLFYGLGKAGDYSRVTGEPPLEVLLGNADGVVVEVGGRPYTYPRRARNGNVAHFSVAAPAD